MSKMREQIATERAKAAKEAAEAEASRAAAEQAKATKRRTQDEALLQVARGLITLSGLLVASGVEPEGWAAYRQSNTVGKFGETGRRVADGEADIKWRFNRPKRIFHRDPLWYLGEWTSAGTDSFSGAETTKTIHNHISASGKVVGAALSHHMVDLHKLNDSQATERLAVLQSGRDPRDLASQIVWSAAHYDLEWPASAPDLDAFLD